MVSSTSLQGVLVLLDGGEMGEFGFGYRTIASAEQNKSTTCKKRAMGVAIYYISSSQAFSRRGVANVCVVLSKTCSSQRNIVFVKIMTMAVWTVLT